MSKHLKTKYIITLFIAILFTSCATLPKATIEMSVLLEKQISVLENNHVDIINLYFEEKKSNAKTTIEKEWYPLFLEEFFKNEIVKEIWDDAVKIDSTEKRMKALKEIVQVIHEKYIEILNSVIEPLEKTHIECLTVIQEEYQKAKQMNRAISENIASVHNLQEARNKLIPIDIKGVENIMYQYMQKADNIMNEVQKTINEYRKK